MQAFKISWFCSGVVFDRCLYSTGSEWYQIQLNWCRYEDHTICQDRVDVYFRPQVNYRCLAFQKTKFNTSLPNDIILKFQETHQSFDIKMTSSQRPTRHKHSNTRIYPRLPLGPRAKPPGLSRVPCISWSRAKCTVTKKLIAWRVSQLGGRWSGVCLFMTKMMAIDSDPTLNTRHHFFSVGDGSWFRWDSRSVTAMVKWML